MPFTRSSEIAEYHMTRSLAFRLRVPSAYSGLAIRHFTRVASSTTSDSEFRVDFRIFSPQHSGRVVELIVGLGRLLYHFTSLSTYFLTRECFSRSTLTEPGSLDGLPRDRDSPTP